MSDKIKEIKVNPKEFISIRLDHYIDVVRKADAYDDLTEMLIEHLKERGKIRND